MRRGADDRAPRPDTRHVLVLGADGLLGHAVFDVVRADRVTGTMRRPLGDVAWWPPFGNPREGARLVDGVDVTDWAALRRLLDELAPDAVVNCVGVTPRRPGAGDPATVILVNALLPHLLHGWCAETGCRLVTISTDCVFGHEPGLFTESDAPTACDLYGRTKALGEVVAADAVTLRTSFVGRELTGRTELLEWFLSNAGGTVAGYAGVWYSGVPVGMAASVVASLAVERLDVSGLHHLAAAPISKLDLLRAAGEAFDAGVTITPEPTPTSHRTLDGSRLRDVLDLPPVRWDEAFRAMAADRRYDLRPRDRVTV